MICYRKIFDWYSLLFRFLFINSFKKLSFLSCDIFDRIILFINFEQRCVKNCFFTAHHNPNFVSSLSFVIDFKFNLQPTLLSIFKEWDITQLFFTLAPYIYIL